MSIFKKLNPFVMADEEASQPQVDPAKPLKEQIGETTGGFNVVPQPQNTVIPSNTIIDGDTHSKFQAYFEKLFTGLNCPKPSYHEFIVMVEAIGGSQQAFAQSFVGFKFQGLTKEALLSTAKQTLEAIQKDATEYNAIQQEKLKTEVEGRKEQIKAKQEQILQLQNEISKLQQEAMQAEGAINGKVSVYNTYSNNYVTKISNDIKCIEMFVQG